MKAINLFLVMIISFVISCNSQEYDIKGKVTDKAGKSPLAGVIVVIKGTSNGTSTDQDGKYALKVPGPKSIVVFSFIGYKTEEIKVKGQKVIDVEMELETKNLDEVTVIQYDDQLNKRQLSEDMKADKKEYEKSLGVKIKGISSPTSSPSQSILMQGRTAGALTNTKDQSIQNVYYNPSTEEYDKVRENGFKKVNDDPLSTFSIDVDKASYSNLRRFINSGEKPPVDAVRIEEMVNYFNYNYPQPTDGHPFAIITEYADCPWQANHKLLQIGLQGKRVALENLPPSNIVFLIDVSGSMQDANKLPLLKSAFKILVNNLREKDKVAIVVYAGSSGLVLPSTKGSEKTKIMEAINQLEAGGSTAGGEGIKLAYKVAQENFIDGGNNRVILATDGDFNVGSTSNSDMEDLIVEKRKSGVFLTCIGVGMGNYKDSKMETLADKGNGNYAYFDNIQEANKVFSTEFAGTLFTIAKDVKIQIEFNPSKVQAYRLVGYENRMLNNEDFKDDTKDAGELGSGHTVTALYEIIPVGVKSDFVKDVDALKYQKITVDPNSQSTNEVATVKFRYKKPDGDKSIEMVHPVKDDHLKLERTSENFRFSSAVAMFGLLLRNSEYKGAGNFDQVVSLASNAKGKDDDGYKAEFVRLVKAVEN